MMKIKMKKSRGASYFLKKWDLSLLFVFMIFSSPVYAEVTLKVTAQNPSEFTAQEVSVKSYLPKKIKLKNILDTGDLEVAYDIKREQYYVYKKILLNPKDRVQFNITIEDIWLLDTSLLDEMKDHVNKISKELLKSEYADTAQGLEDEIFQGMEDILKRQKEFSIEQAEPVEHINAYVINQEQWNQVKEKVGTLEKLLEIVSKKGDTFDSLNEKSLGIKKGVRVVKLLAAKGEDVFGQDTELGADCFNNGEEVVINEAPKQITFKIDVENPSQDISQTIPFKYFLVKEVKAADVIDSQGLQIGFDFDKQLYYLFDNAVTLKAGEEKSYEVILKNKWIIDRTDLFSLKIHVDNMLRTIEGKRNFSEMRDEGRRIVKDLDQLLHRNVMKVFDEEYVKIFREDQKRIADIRKEIIGMEKGMMRSGIQPEITVVNAKRICEEAKKLGLTSEEIDTKQKIKWKKSAEGISKEINLLAGTIFQGKALSTESTWKIIQYIIFFLMLISGTFYFTHIRQKESIMFDALTGVFTRAYILERLKEELKIARGSKSMCSLLILDLDKFKTINDTYGHAVGDTILKEFVVALRKGIRATDLVGRYGGDEFLVVLPMSSKEVAYRIAEDIAQAVRNHEIVIGQQEFNITASIGVSTFPEDSTTSEDLFNKADQALYKTKKKGRDGVSVYEA